MIDKVLQTIRDFELLKPGDRILIGFSAGPDSVALLSVLMELRFPTDICYVDHGLRPVQPEIKLCEEYAKRYGIRCYIERIRIEAKSEDQLRRARYGILNRISQKGGYDCIGIGHNLNDQIETIIINIIRGSTRIRPIPPKREKIIRPLIEVTKDEILRYLKGKKLTYMKDPTNELPVYTRNVIRKEVVPILLKLNPGFYKQLRDNIRIWLNDEGLLDAIIPQSGKGLDIGKIKTYNLPMRRRIIRKWLVENTSTLPNHNTIDRVMSLTSAQSGRMVPVGRRWVIREFDRIRFLTKTEPYKVELTIPGMVQIGRGQIACEVITERPSRFDDDVAYFDLNQLNLPLYVRSWRSGDWIKPFGMVGKKKLKEIWNERRIPYHLRYQIPILTDKSEIIWIAGIRRGRKAPLTEKTKQILKVWHETE
ncbi:MAG TPA: tRNA lysidine(34) synthetase TilS [bacterium (Candidatus Stahlbacteria)]|nr:tRNA lysidine(34) synthetase TilS [Candidatus Stahlbacteria bacterium]